LLEVLRYICGVKEQFYGWDEQNFNFKSPSKFASRFEYSKE